MKLLNTIYLAALTLIFSTSSYGQKKVNYTPPRGDGFCLLELFTSEGCSSCPAADKAMVQLANEYKHNFYTLEFHVDYWNYLGWKDEYSDPDYTARQQQYVSRFHLSSAYTPQVVINGMVEEVGSDMAKMRPYLNQYMLRAPKTTLNLSATGHLGKVFVAYTTNNTQGELLNVALVQNKVLTNVRRGENEGRKLTHFNVVRYFKTIAITENHGFVEVMLPQGVVAEQCSIIAYTQDKNSWEVTSATSCAITPESH